MCGIAGIWSARPLEALPPAWPQQVRAMLTAIRHRGPDGDGLVAEGGAAMGACRLAIIDPEHGAQPMRTGDGRFTLSLNGAVVNHVELRADLERAGARFRTHCDTEVLLELLARDGAAGLSRVNGMFAGAFHDARDGSLTLFRDPCGIKPLYWTLDGERVLYASEPKALLLALPRPPRLCEEALLDYLSFQIPLGDRTFFDGVRRLPPGTVLTLRPGREPALSPLPAWSGSIDVPDDVDAAARSLGELIDDAVRLHLRADVPLGAHLSGGVDSSLVAATAARHLGAPLPVFTGAFDVDGFDERPHARAVAAEIGATCHEVVPGPLDLAEALPRAVRAMDEPVAGPGLLPQWFVARRAAQSVKVALGGQGGDELFSGYVRHLVLRLELALQDAIRGGDTRALRTLASHLDALDGYGPLLRRQFGSGLFDAGADRYMTLLHRGAGLPDVLTGDLASAFAAHPAEERFRAAYRESARPGDQPVSPVADAARFDRRWFLPALLQVEDRTSMAWSLESRVPLLDRRVLAFVDRCPDALLLGDGELKFLLRRAAGDRLPAAARRRRDKMGFPVPLAAWARGPLESFFADLLTDRTARSRGFYDARGVERLLAGESIEARHLWALVNVELWHREFSA